MRLSWVRLDLAGADEFSVRLPVSTRTDPQALERQAAAASFAGRPYTPEVIPSCASADWTSSRAL
jgi:hypothetical protein